MMRKVILLYLLFFSVGVIYADNDYVTVFKVAGNICTPVTLKTPYGTYEVTKEISIKVASALKYSPRALAICLICFVSFFIHVSGKWCSN